MLRLQSLRPSVGVSIVPRYFELLSWRSTVKDVAGLPLIDVAPPSLGWFARMTKRTLDVILATAALVVLSPLLVASAVAVKASSPGPVLFRQERTGRDGKKFEILKLRTMEVGAEARKAPAAGEEGANVLLFKMEDDPTT